MIDSSQRCKALPSYVIDEIQAIKRRLLAQGRDVIDLGAGDADLDPPDIAVRGMREALEDRAMSRYAFQLGLADYRTAVADYMKRRFGVELDPVTQLLPLLGSKEGLAHLPFAVLDPGDVCVVPEPGYPPYIGGAKLAGATIEVYPLEREKNFLVELEDLGPSVLERTRLVYLNYPNNPTTAVAPRDYLERTVEICGEYGIVLAYDNPYCEMTFNDYVAPSVLEIPGASEVAVEFHSFSKSYGMTGWRIAWAAGNQEIIRALMVVKRYVDTGPFLAIQKAASKVLDRAEKLTDATRRMFQERRDALVEGLAEMGFHVEAPVATMYLWMPLPEGVSSLEFTRKLLEEEFVVALAGASLGAAGEGYVRLAFTAQPERLREAARRFARCLHSVGASTLRA